MPALLRSLLLCFVVFAAPVAALSQAARESLLIGAGDLVAVHVFREDDLDTKSRVKDAGTITLPLIGSIDIAGMSPSDAAEAIAQQYSGRGFLAHPQVSVLVEQSATGQVAVLGEVAHPGAVAISNPRNLLDVLAEAGGLLKTADRRVTVSHPGGASVTVLVANEAASQLTAISILVAPGDTVLVPRAGIVYVLGDVGRPGGYLMQDDAQLSLMQALALADGVSRTAAEGSARLIRKVNGMPATTPLHLKAIERGTAKDLALENNDIVYVPFSFTKNLALGASTVAASASSAIIYAAF